MFKGVKNWWNGLTPDEQLEAFTNGGILLGAALLGAGVSCLIGAIDAKHDIKEDAIVKTCGERLKQIDEFRANVCTRLDFLECDILALKQGGMN